MARSMSTGQGLTVLNTLINPIIPARVPWYGYQYLWFLRVRVMGMMFMIFGFVALFLASVGLYAVMSFSVSRCMREVGIRMALGARGVDVVRMSLGQGALQLAVGLTVGLALVERREQSSAAWSF